MLINNFFIINLFFISLVFLQGCGLVYLKKSEPIPVIFSDIVSSNQPEVRESNQIIFVVNEEFGINTARLYTYEKRATQWTKKFAEFNVSIGRNGFAKINEKREGDGKTPSGIYSLGPVFGYEPKIDIKMEYIQSTKEDFWVDDPASDQYNTWVRGKPNAKSFEKMVLSDNEYKYVIVVRYNMSPIIKGNGSAIFVHIWEGQGKSTAGCIVMSEENITKIVRWLDSAKKPLIIMGTEQILHSLTK